MRLSVLILTHNRPQLFDRCVRSALANIPPDVEIIVNNDSRDIVEVQHPSITYHYNQYSSLCGVYEFLLMQARGEYVYYLEDDDYLTPNLYNTPLDVDVICGNYVPMYETPDVLAIMNQWRDGVNPPSIVGPMINEEHLQLSQYIFRRSVISGFPFAYDSHIHNDLRLVRYALDNAERVRTTSRVLYHQTTDGRDNISFPKYANNR